MTPARLTTVIALAPLVACSMPTASPGGPSTADAGTGDWACATDAATTDDPPTAGQQPRTSAPGSVRVREAYSGVPVADADVMLCDGADQDCAAPIAHARADATGTALFATEGGPSVSGAVLRVTASEIPTHYVFLAGRGPTAGSTELDVDVYIPAALEAMARLAGVAWDPASPVVRVDAQDCAGATAAGVTVSIGGFGAAQPVVAYLDGGGRPTRLTSTTDASGIALGFGGSPGSIGVADLLNGQPAGGALGFARAGAVSMLVVRP